MEQLTNEEKAKVFAMYWGQDVVKHPCDRVLFRFYGVVPLNYQAMNLINADLYPYLYGDWSGGTNPELSCYSRCEWEEISLCLTPLSSITDEHAIEVAKVLGYELETGAMLLLGKDYCKDFLSRPCIGSDWRKIMVYHYLISKGYDVPLFFGVGHLCNGMTAIQLGIAIDKNTLS